MVSSRIYLLTVVTLFAVGSGCQKDGLKGLSSAWQGKDDRIGSDVEDAPKPRISPKTHLASAKMLERRNNLEDAIQQYEKAIEAEPSLIEAYNRLGMVHLRLKQFEKAEHVFKRGIDVRPESATVRNNLGFCYLKQKRYKKAEEVFRLALAISPEYKRARMNLAVALARTQRLGASAIEFSRVVPKEVAFFNVAVICMDMKKYDHAEQALVRALAVNPNYGPAKTQMERVNRLQNATGGEPAIVRSAPDRKEKQPSRRGTVTMTPLVGHSSNQRDIIDPSP